MIFASAKELYGMFLDSDWWRELSERKRKIVGQCERCQAKKRLQSHHKIYREHWFDTELGDLEVLCRQCHEKEHGIGDKAENGQAIPKHAFLEDPKPVSNPGKPIYMMFFTYRELEIARGRKQITKFQFKEGRRTFISLGANVLSKSDRKRISKQNRQRNNARKKSQRPLWGRRKKRKKLVVGPAYEVLSTDRKFHYAFKHKVGWQNRGASSN